MKKHRVFFTLFAITNTVGLLMISLLSIHGYTLRHSSEWPRAYKNTTVRKSQASHALEPNVRVSKSSGNVKKKHS